MALKVVVINDFGYVNGGASKFAILTAIKLAERGHEVVFFCAVPPVSKELRSSKCKIVCTEQKDILSNSNKFSAAIQGIWNFRAYKIFNELLKDYNPEKTILHFHSWTKALSSSIFNVAIKNNFKVVCTIHDYFIVCPNGGFFNYKKNEFCQVNPLSLKCIVKDCDVRNYAHKLWRVKRQIIQKYFAGIPDKIKNFIFPSPFSKSIIQPFLKNDSKIYEISNPVELEKDKPVQAYKNKIYAYVGRLSKEKGVLLFAKASSLLDIETLFIGDGYLRNEILKINPKAKITGWLSNNELKEELKKVRVLIFPSLCYEVQGMAVVEAKAMGIPVIVSNITSAREYVKDRITGLLFKSGSLDDLIEKIKLSFDDELVKSLSENSYNDYWSKPITIEKYIEKLENCYNFIINS